MFVSRKYGLARVAPGLEGITQIGDFTLESGQRLSAVSAAWQASDSGCFEGRDTVLLLHGLADSHHFWCDRAPLDLCRGWGNRLIGEGRAIDTGRFSVVSLNMLGSSFGSTGPQSIAPGSARPYGMRFPAVSVADQACFIARAIKALAIGSIRAVIGCAYGGYVTLELAHRACFGIDRAAVIGVGPRGAAVDAVVTQLRRLAVSGDRTRFMQWRRRVLLSYGMPEDEAEVGTSAGVWSQEQSPVGLLRLHEGLAQFDVQKRVRELACALLVLRVRDDPYFPVPSRRSRDWPFPRRTTYFTLPGGGHHALLRHPSTYAHKLQQFLTA